MCYCYCSQLLSVCVVFKKTKVVVLSNVSVNDKTGVAAGRLFQVEKKYETSEFYKNREITERLIKVKFEVQYNVRN